MRRKSKNQRMLEEQKAIPEEPKGDLKVQSLSRKEALAIAEENSIGAKYAYAASTDSEHSYCSFILNGNDEYVIEIPISASSIFPRLTAILGEYDSNYILKSSKEAVSVPEKLWPKLDSLNWKPLELSRRAK